jgi:hypothetical protein
MKKLTILALVLAAFGIFGTNQASAYGRNPHYRYGRNGYWDNHNRYHHWQRYHNHDGYWDNSGGTRVFINI